MLEPRGKFNDLLVSLFLEGTRIEVLHSKDDTVLHYAFPYGQSLAGGGEGSARALGRYGPTPLMPGFHATMTEREIAGAGHSDYWGHSKSDPSRVATEEAGRFLSLGEIGRSLGTERSTGAPSPVPITRDVGTPRELSEIG
jgi:hypothetical protein